MSSGNGSFGIRLRTLREGMDLSLRDLADRSGVSAPMLSQVERGETSPTLAVAERIAGGLALSLSQLLRLDEVFRTAGFDWRSAGCSMCLGMNPDIAAPGERVASTSNRNFEGRQGRGARSHLVSPKMAAAAAIEGHFVDIREWS